jgi:uncharacterized membrane protein
VRPLTFPMNAIATAADPTPRHRAYRMASIDMLRGLVIIVMALDHVRDYVMIGSTQDPTADPTVSPLLFFTRWITHFCAPTFVLLAGVSAGLMAERKSPSLMARFLVSRGLWLILVEILVISTASSFAPRGIAQLGGHTYVGLQVFWAIGASMVVLAAAQFLGRKACLAAGAAIILGHNLLDTIWPTGMAGTSAPLWLALHARHVYEVGPGSVYFSYPVLPWIGVMLVGYGAAGLFQTPEPVRDQRLLCIGVGLVLGFILIRAVNQYGDPHSWHLEPHNLGATVMSFLTTTKYPPSLLYLLMTLGPAAIACAFAERLRGSIRVILMTYGRAPFAFYVAHLYLIHALALLLGVAQGFTAQQFLTHYRYFPSGFGLHLSGVYLVWLLVVTSLYPLCRWMASLKARRADWWFSYI